MLAARMVSQFVVTSFAAINNEEPIVIASEWTGGELGTDYQRACGKDLSPR
jgi:hypothetical protein